MNTYRRQSRGAMAWPWQLLAAMIILLLGEVASAEGDTPNAGQLTFSGGEEALHLGTEVDMTVKGLHAEVEVRQRFKNNTDGWMNATYTYPLAEDSAVNRLKMVIGERIIEGEIQEKEQARATFERAKAAGQRTTLVEQQRPNLFRQQVANIGPGETIEIRIGYSQSIVYDSGEFRLRMPMTLTPRYIPGVSRADLLENASLTPATQGWALPTDVVTDAHLITPRQRHPGAGELMNPIRLSLRLHAGFELAGIDSATHKIQVTEKADYHEVHLSAGEVSMDRDFELTWTPTIGQEPVAALFHDHWRGEDYVQVLLMPPQTLARQQVLPREMLLIIDVSGSMSGTSIVQARESALQALDKLAPGDRFNIIVFSSDASQLFTGAVPATAANVAEARHYVSGLQANGGTEILPALKRAFAHTPVESHLQQMVFVTDGSVGNEAQLLAYIQRHAGDARLFTVAIGSAPNRYFLRRAAEMGRGSLTEIADVSQVKSRMAALLEKLEKPLVTDIQLDWPQPVQMFPRQVPDLYWGEPLLVTAKLPPWPARASAQLTITGKSAGKTWGRDIPLDFTPDSTPGKSEAAPLLAQRFAREKITFIENQHYGDAGGDKARAEILPLALEYQLMSRFTSLVAVDKTPARPAEEDASDHSVANAMPAGSSMRAPYPQTATGLYQHLLLGALTLLALLLIRRPGVKYAY